MIPAVIESIRSEDKVMGNTETFTFSETHTTVPIVSMTLEPRDPDDENINAFVSSISKTAVTIDFSSNFTGRVHIQALSKS